VDRKLGSKKLKAFIIESKYAPVIARTLPTSSVVKFNPPKFRGLTDHKEKT